MGESGETVRDRVRGALLGLAVGDAVGTTVEFMPPGTFPPVEDMTGGGPFRLKAGQWTDDTSLALCLAESLIEKRCFDPVDQLNRYVRWWQDGHMSSTGSCFDIGGQTRRALEEHSRTSAPFCGPVGERNAGNGSLMRLAPVPMAYHRSPAAAMVYGGESSRTTHGNRECVDACRYFSGLLVGAFAGAFRDEILSPHFCPVSGMWEAEPLSPNVADVAGGSFRRKQQKDVQGSGYVVSCLEAALWAFSETGSFKEAILRAVNLGDDADTTAAVCGQIAGAFYGEQAIPSEWLRKLARRELIEELAEGLLQYGRSAEP